MADKLHHGNDSIEASSGGSLTLEAILGDGTSINLTVSPASKVSSPVTASTTFTHTSFSFEINTSPPTQVLPLRKTNPLSPKSPPLDEPPKLTSTKSPLAKSKKTNKMPGPVTLPEDVVAIDTGSRSLLFYVTPDAEGRNRLSFLESPDDTGTGDYKTRKILTAMDKDENAENILVSAKNKQVAAITWGGSEVRVYYVDKAEHLREVCRGSDGQWKIGALGSGNGNKVTIRANTSISASVHTYGSNNYNLRVFAAEEGQFNDDELPQISVYKFVHDETSKSPRWGGQWITSATKKY